jgi:hypothetical protein
MIESTKYQRLPEEVDVHGTGIPNESAVCLQRSGRVALYCRSGHIYEVFIVQTREAGEVFGREYPAREVYPGNEDFGVTAWCYVDEKLALKRYKYLVHVSVTHSQNTHEVLKVVPEYHPVIKI